MRENNVELEEFQAVSGLRLQLPKEQSCHLFWIHPCGAKSETTSSGYTRVVLKVKPPLPGKSHRPLGIINTFIVQVARDERDCRPRQQASLCPGQFWWGALTVSLGNKQNPNLPLPHKKSQPFMWSGPKQTRQSSRPKQESSTGQQLMMKSHLLT